MNKKFLKVSAVLCATLMLPNICFAKSIDEIKKDVNGNSSFTILGQVEPENINEIVTVTVKKITSTTLNDEQLKADVLTQINSYNFENIVEFGNVIIDENGKVEYSFNLPVTREDEYAVIGFYKDKADIERLIFVDEDRLNEIIAFIADNSKSDSDRLNYLYKYQRNLELDLKNYTSDYEKMIIIKNIKENALLTASPSLSELQKSVKDKAFAEIKFIYDLKAVIDNFEIYNILYNNSVIGIDFSKYDLCGTTNKTNIRNDIMSYAKAQSSLTAQMVKAEFERISLNYYNSQNNNGNNNSPSTNYGGGGGGGGGYTPPVQNIPDKDIINNTVFFSDISSTFWAYDSIMKLSGSSIISGYPDNTFRPNDYIKREELCKIIAVANGFTASDKTSFADVDDGAWYADYVNALYENGIIKGISETEFGVGNNVSRQDLAVIIYRLYIKNGNAINGEKTDFSDGEEISDYAKEAVAKLGYAKIINGRGNNLFAPKDFATRAEVAQLIASIS